MGLLPFLLQVVDEVSGRVGSLPPAATCMWCFQEIGKDAPRWGLIHSGSCILSDLVEIWVLNS